MKSKIKHILLVVFAFVSMQSYSQKAVDYLNKINKEFEKISEETWDYTRAVAHNKKARQIESQRKDMISANRSALSRIKKMPAFDESTAYRDSIASFLELSYLVLNNDYSKIVDMEEIADQTYDAMEAYMMAQQLANEKLDMAMDVANEATEKFAQDNDINLIKDDSETGAKLEKAGEVFKYYNKIYLIFFKPYKQEAYLIEAQNKSDINAMKQNIESMAKFALEAKLKLKEIKAFKNNNSLVIACNQLLDFYMFESTKTSTLIDFYLKKEKFEKLKAEADKKGKNLSQQEAKEMNAAIAEYNKSLIEFNKINTELNNKRSIALNNWNNAVSKFLDKNVSKER